MHLTVRHVLNLIASGTEQKAIIAPQISPDEAKLALHSLESNALFVGALRLVIEAAYQQDTPEKAAAVDHATKLIKIHDEIVAKRTAPSPVALAPAKKDVEDQDVADLV